MEIQHEVQRQTFEKISEYLGELFENPYLDEENGHFYVRYGTTVLEVSVDPYGPEEASVRIMAYCVQGAELSQNLLLGLLELNHSLPYGAFSLAGNDIFFSHSLFGHSLDPRNLLSAIEVVAMTSDDYDERIVAKYGGETALERIQTTGGRRQREEGTSSGD